VCRGDEGNYKDKSQLLCEETRKSVGRLVETGSPRGEDNTIKGIKHETLSHVLRLDIFLY